MKNREDKVELFESYEIAEIEDRRELFDGSNWLYWCSECSDSPSIE